MKKPDPKRAREKYRRLAKGYDRSDGAAEGVRLDAIGRLDLQSGDVVLIVVMFLISRRYITTYEGFRRPWSHLKRFVPNLKVEPRLFGAAYIAWGTVPPSTEG